MQKIISLSVHDIVDNILRSGSIDSRVFSSGTMQEGTRLHSVYQDEQSSVYQKEVSLSSTFTIGEYTFIVEGRADGIITDKNGKVTIDEIKTTVADLEEFYTENKDWHLGQAQFYAYIYALQNNLSEISIRLTYISQNNYAIRKFYDFDYNFEDLQRFVLKLVQIYYDHILIFLNHEEKLKKDLSSFDFPYSTYRKGQKELIQTIYDAADNEEFAYIEAPTGIGKTAATLYPYIKKMQDKGEKIFYLTSKNSIKKVVLETIKFFNTKGVTINAITINSKESLCINDKKRHCNPDECPFAVDYYQKVNAIIHAIYQEYPCLGFQDIISLSYRYQVCPFEFQLDLSTFYDVIIADYNHLFHPTAHLIRFFDEGPKNYYLLIDEAHNLPSRIRDMHSGQIDFYSFFLLYKDFKAISFNHKKMYRLIKKVMDYFLNLDINEFPQEDFFGNVLKVDGIPDELFLVLDKFLEEGKNFLQEGGKDVTDQFLDVYYKAKSFLSLPESDETYSYFFEISENGKLLKFNANCLDSRPFMRPAKNIFLSGTFFSATLTPQNFFLDLLKAEEKHEELFLPSPFPVENLKVLVNTNVSTYYKDRDFTKKKIIQAILAFVGGKTGNYFVFFPSYKYMTAIVDIFPLSKNYNFYIQDAGMTTEKREEFLAHFEKNPTKTNIGFVVLGGVFSEGIDLIDDRLIGAIIIGVGLSMVNYENDALKNYYDLNSSDDEEKQGYLYSYVYPGINKFLQAAGRVIRSEFDKGMLLYIDMRYNTFPYRNILTEKYQNISYVYTEDEITQEVDDFWRNK